MGTWKEFDGTFPNPEEPLLWFWGLANANWYKLIYSKYGEAFYSGTETPVSVDDLVKIQWIQQTTYPE